MALRPSKPALAAGSALLALVVADLAVGAALDTSAWSQRRLPPFGTWFPEQTHEALATLRTRGPRDHGQGVFDAELGWTNRQGSAGSATREVINAIGARATRDHDPLPAPGVRRIVCYGESYTFGTEVADGEEWPARLDALLEHGEVINLGVGAYGQDQALLRFRRKGLMGAEIATLGLMLENIARNVNRYRNRYSLDTIAPVVKPRFLLRDGELELLPSPYATQVELYEAALAGRVPSETEAHEFWSDDRPLVPGSALAALWLRDDAVQRRQRTTHLWADTGAEPFRVTVALLEAFHREALAAGAREAPILVFPARPHMIRLVRGEEPVWQTLFDELDRRGVPYIDLAPVLIEHADEHELYLSSHPTPFAHQRIAEHLASRFGAPQESPSK